MAADIDALVALLRIDLHDEDSENYRWVDATLERHLERAVAELSAVRPQEVLTELATTEGSRVIDVSAEFTDLVRIEAVEYPVDQEPRAFVQWSLWADNLELLVDATPGDADPVNAYWTALHVVDGNGSTVPAQYDALLLTGAAGYAAQEWASYATNRANVAGPGAVRDYGSWSAARLEEFRAGLRRLRRLRTAAFYTPARPEPDQSTVIWDP
ncbi:MAG TPA: hypothetical protein VFS30_01100 [Dehalococcoidia bacterium]|nr:hypothetical protein [Dehalococcoidia bacterium]